MTNEELLTAIRTQGDPDRRLTMELWNRNSGIVRKACKRFRKSLEPEDAHQEAFVAFNNAVVDYSMESDRAFASYLYDRIVWHLARYTQNTGGVVRVPSYQRDRIRRYRQLEQSYYTRSGEPLPDETACCMLNISPEQLERMKADMYALSFFYLDAPLPDVGDGDGTGADVLPDNTDVERDIIENIYDQERQRAVWTAVDSLPEKEAHAIRMYYQRGATYKNIAEKDGVSVESIRRRIASGFRKLRIQHAHTLRDYCEPARVYNMAVQGCGVGTYSRTWESSTERTAFKELERIERLRAVLLSELKSTD